MIVLNVWQRDQKKIIFESFDDRKFACAPSSQFASTPCNLERLFMYLRSVFLISQPQFLLSHFFCLFFYFRALPGWLGSIHPFYVSFCIIYLNALASTFVEGVHVASSSRLFLYLGAGRWWGLQRKDRHLLPARRKKCRFLSWIKRRGWRERERESEREGVGGRATRIFRWQWSRG